MNSCTKYYPLLLLISFAAVCCSVHAQSKSALDSIYVFSKIDSAEIYFTRSDYDSALYFANKAENYSRSKNYQKGIAFAQIERTDIFLDQDELNKATALALKTYSIGQEIHDSLVMAVASMQRAQALMYNSDFADALPFFEKCTQYFKNHPSRFAALAFNDYGHSIGMMGDLKSKATYLLKAISVYEEINSSSYGDMAVVLNNLATLYYELHEPAKAIEYAVKSVAYREKDGDLNRLALGCCNLSQIYRETNTKEAEHYCALCVKYAELSGDEDRMVQAYVTYALIAGDQQDIKKNFEYELKAISVLEKNHRNPQFLARRYVAAALGARNNGKDSATVLGYLDKSISMSLELQDRFNLRDGYLQLANFYNDHHDYEAALKAYKKHIAYRDSIVSSNTQSSIAELEKKYQTEKKDNEISRLNADQKIKALQIEKQKALIAGNLVEAQRKENEIQLLSQSKELQGLKIKQQDEQLEKQLLLATSNEQKLQLANKEKELQQRKLKSTELTRNFILAAVLLLVLLGFVLFNRYQLKRKVEEQEALLAVRNNIAKDLHDEIGSTLTSIRILSEVSGKNLLQEQTRASEFIKKIAEQSTAAQQGISDIVWAVKPENDRLENMVIRMREYVAQTLESKNVQTRIDIEESLLSNSLNMNQRRELLLIFKEAVNNIAKYAAASEVIINLMRIQQHLLLEIKDNGHGFDPNALRSSNGLKNMQARAASLNGSIEIISKPGEGSTVRLLIPAT